MAISFKDFLRTSRPPPDGRYQWRITAFDRNDHGITFTLAVADGEFAKLKLSQSMKLDRDGASIERLFIAVDVDSAERESDLIGRTFFATKVTSERGYTYLRAITAGADIEAASPVDGDAADES